MEPTKPVGPSPLNVPPGTVVELAPAMTVATGSLKAAALCRPVSRIRSGGSVVPVHVHRSPT